MEKRPETKQEKLIFDSIARHYDEWIDIYAIAKDTRMIPADCDKYLHELLDKELIVRDEKVRFRLSKKGRHLKHIHTWTEKANILIKENKPLLWFSLGILGILVLIVSC